MTARRTATRFTAEEALHLLEHEDFVTLMTKAHEARLVKHPANSPVTYVIDRNINYTNVCNVSCTFCAFAKKECAEDAYVLSYDDIKPKLEELKAAGGTQILMQGGHHPKLKLEYYTQLLSQIKKDYPGMTLHSLSAGEIYNLANLEKLSLTEVISELKRAGLNSLPGAGAEILVDRVRRVISPLKLSAEQWLETFEIAHKCGLGGSATMMFRHVESLAERIEHLQKLRDLQDKTGVFRSFIGWTYEAENTGLKKLYDKQQHLPKHIDYLRTLAVARLFLDNINHVQASWVTQGFGVGQMALHAGADDFGGTMLEENVVSAAGSTTSKSNADELCHHIRKAGFIPAQRDTYYNILNVKKLN